VPNPKIKDDELPVDLGTIECEPVIQAAAGEHWIVCSLHLRILWPNERRSKWNSSANRGPKIVA